MVTIHKRIPSWDGKYGNTITQWESSTNNHGRPIEPLKSSKGPVTIFIIISVIAFIIGMIWGAK